MNSPLSDSNNERVLDLIETLVLRFLGHLSHNHNNGHVDGGLNVVALTVRNTVLRNNGALAPGEQHHCIQLAEKNLSTLARVFGILAESYNNVLCGNRATQRQVYYALMHLFPDQEQLNRTIILCTSVLGVPRWMLGIGTATRGVVAGRLFVAEPGALTAVNCANVGTVCKQMSVPQKCF